MGAALLILGKDLRLRARDRSVFLFAFIVPIGLTFLFSAMFPDTETLLVTGAVVDEDGGQISATFADRVLPAVAESGILELAPVEDAAAAEAALREGNLDAAWVIPAGFSDAVTSGRSAEIQVLVSPDEALAGEVARSVATTWTNELEATALTVATTQQVGDGGVDPAAITSNWRPPTRRCRWNRC